MPEMTIFYVNQAYQTYKCNKKVYYCDFYISGQITPCLNTPEDQKSYEFKPNEGKIFTPEYDTVFHEFLGLVETLGYLTIRGEQ